MDQFYEMNGETISFQTKFKKRKTLGIYIDGYGQIEIRVPKGTTESQINQLIESKWHWIISKLTEIKTRTDGYKPKTYEQGEPFMYLGTEVVISVLVDPLEANERVYIEGDQLIVKTKSDDNEKIKKMLESFYSKECKRIVEMRLKYYQANFKVKPKGVKITNNKSNWGTCNSHRELTFNWKLVMAPLEVFDYVVIHEMCHMVHMNHDRSFWRLVGKLMPDYEVKQQYLRQFYWKMTV